MNTKLKKKKSSTNSKVHPTCVIWRQFLKKFSLLLIEEKKQFFPEWTFFFDFGYKRWFYQMIAFVLRIQKNHFFFQLILLEKHFDKMTMSRSSICNFFWEEIPPTSAAWKKKLNVEKKEKSYWKKTFWKSSVCAEISACRRAGQIQAENVPSITLLAPGRRNLCR